METIPRLPLPLCSKRICIRYARFPQALYILYIEYICPIRGGKAAAQRSEGCPRPPLRWLSVAGPAYAIASVCHQIYSISGPRSKYLIYIILLT